MKKLRIKILGVLLAGTMLISCNKWVEYNPKDDFKITDQEYLRSEANYRSMSIGVYSPLQWLNQIVPVGDIITDNSVAGGESASDVQSLQQIDNFTHGSVMVLYLTCGRQRTKVLTGPITCINTKKKTFMVKASVLLVKMLCMAKYIF